MNTLYDKVFTFRANSRGYVILYKGYIVGGAGSNSGDVARFTNKAKRIAEKLQDDYANRRPLPPIIYAVDKRIAAN